jgi:hypothetical protein
VFQWETLPAWLPLPIRDHRDKVTGGGFAFAVNNLEPLCPGSPSQSDLDLSRLTPGTPTVAHTVRHLVTPATSFHAGRGFSCAGLIL